MENQLTIIAMVYKIDHWSNFENVKNKLKDSLGNMIFSEMGLKEPKQGYIEITPAKGCENRIRETIRYEMPLTEFAPIYFDGNKRFSEFYFIKNQN